MTILGGGCHQLVRLRGPRRALRAVGWKLALCCLVSALLAGSLYAQGSKERTLDEIKAEAIHRAENGMYPLIALGYVWVTITAVVAFHETMNPLKLVGLVIIILGVGVLGYGGGGK